MERYYGVPSSRRPDELSLRWTKIPRSSPNISMKSWSWACSRRVCAAFRICFGATSKTTSKAVGFKLNDIHFREFVVQGRPGFLIRHKERKFGRGCIGQWRAQQKGLLKQLEANLVHTANAAAPAFFCWVNCLASWISTCSECSKIFLFSDHYQLPGRPKQIRQMAQCRPA